MIIITIGGKKMVEPINEVLMDIARLELSHDQKSNSICISLTPKDSQHHDSIPPLILAIMCTSYGLNETKDPTIDQKVDYSINKRIFTNTFSLEMANNSSNNTPITVILSVLKNKALFDSSGQSDVYILAEHIANSIEKFIEKIKAPTTQSKANTSFTSSLFAKAPLLTSKTFDAETQTSKPTFL